MTSVKLHQLCHWLLNSVTDCFAPHCTKTSTKSAAHARHRPIGNSPWKRPHGVWPWVPSQSMVNLEICGKFASSLVAFLRLPINMQWWRIAERSKNGFAVIWGWDVSLRVGYLFFQLTQIPIEIEKWYVVIRFGFEKGFSTMFKLSCLYLQGFVRMIPI